MCASAGPFARRATGLPVGTFLRRAGRVFAIPESGADGHGASGDGDFWSALP